MKKTLIALALTALPVVSMADVVLYGDIKGGIEVSKAKDVSGTVTNLVDYGSYIGFKGSEQLNGDLKAIWQVEQGVDIAGGAYGENGTRGFGTKDSFVGLTGGFGTVKAGHQSTPVKELNGKLDVWSYDDGGFATSGTLPSAAGLGMFTRGTDAVDRYVAVTYETPNFNGVSAKAFVSPSDNNSTKFDPITGDAKVEDSSVYGLSASYAQPNGGFFADVAGTYVRDGDTVQRLQAATGSYSNNEGYQALAQVGYETQNWMLGAAYQRTHDVSTIRNTPISRSNEAILTGTFNVDPALRLKASGAYGWGFKGADKAKLLGNGKYYQGIIGADYALSKRTVANGQVGYIKFGKDEDKASYGTVSVGVSHKF